MKPLISIVIPTYNRAEDLSRALKSVFSQTFTNWEALVIDNHSIDNTDELIKSFKSPKIKLFKVHNNGIIAMSRNLGVKHASGEYISFLDSDDWWLPQKLEESIKYLELGADIVYHDLFYVTSLERNYHFRRTRGRNLKSPVFYDLIKNGNTLPNSSVVVKKVFLEAINYLSEDQEMIGSEDYDAWLRIAKKTEKFLRIPKTLGFYWAGGGNISNPERTLKFVSAIEKRYASTIPKLDARNSIFWLNYIKGRAYYLLKDNEKAKYYLGLNRWSRAPFLISLKTCWMLFWIKLYPSSKRKITKKSTPIAIGLIKSEKAFSPEIEGYSKYFQSSMGMKVKVFSSFQEADANSDIVIVFFGFIPFWTRHKSIVIAEYHSLSVGKLSFIKNLLKRLLNIRGEHYIFLNETVRKKLFFSNRLSYSYRGMGFDAEECVLSADAEKKYDFVYSGVVGRSGVIDAISRIESLGFNIAVVGNTEKEGLVLSGISKNIICFGKVPLKKSYEIMASAKYGLNYTPDDFPLNIQDSTKVIEYCALGLGVVTNRYEWVNDFEKKIGARFLSLENVNDSDSVYGFEFKRGEIEQYSWKKVIEKSDVKKFIYSLLDNVEHYEAYFGQYCDIE